jgi:hypothetical protein
MGRHRAKMMPGSSIRFHSGPSAAGLVLFPSIGQPRTPSCPAGWLLSDGGKARLAMLDFSRVEMDAIRAGVPGSRRGLPGGVACRRFLGTVWAQQHCGIDWPAGHDDLRSARRPYPSCLRVARPAAQRPPRTRGPRLRPQSAGTALVRRLPERNSAAFQRGR